MLGKRFELKLPQGNQPIPKLGGECSSIALAMLARALQYPNRPAFCQLSADASNCQAWFSWGQIAHWVSTACDAIRLFKLPAGTHLATVQPNSAEWFVLDLACQTLGYVHVAIDHRWPESMVGKLILQSQSRLVYGLPASYSSPDRSSQSAYELQWSLNWETTTVGTLELQKLLEVAATISSHQPAQMLFTSGTSGEPRGVLLSHRNLVSNALAKLDAAPQAEQDLRLNILPFCHAYARTCELSTWVLSNSRLAIAADWDDFLRQAQALRPTLINLVPHLAHKLLYQGSSKQKLQPEEVASRLGGQVRLLQVGGAAISEAVWHDLDKSGLPPLQGYGLTEASPVVCSNRAGQQRPGTIGPPVAGVELRVDELGQLWVRGEGVMLGYFDDATATQNRIQEGWLATGDLVDQDELGHYRLKGRLSEFIALSTGHKVSPELIEARLEHFACFERVLLAGENRPYLVALVWPAWSQLPTSLFGHESCDRDTLDFLGFYNLMAEWVRRVLAGLPEYAQPQKFIIRLESLDSSLLTPKGSLRRRLALSQFQAQIDQAYTTNSNICVG
jgi:long-chain acyl-CoA synthetase